MKLFKWTSGRQKSPYNKVPLLLLGYGDRPTVPWLGFLDCYILKYGPGSFVNKHKDTVGVENPDSTTDHYAHHRLNIVLKKSKQGGDFVCTDTAPNCRRFFRGRVVFFRSDLCEHSVSKVTEGTRYVLSIGWGNFTKSYKTTASVSD